MAEKELTFWDHLDELRRVLFRVLGVWFVLAIGYFIAMPYLFDNVILAPCHNDFIFYDLLRWIGQKLDLQDDFFTQEFHVKLVNINLAAPFFVHMSTAFWMSVVTAAPYIFYEIWRFVSPALYPNERKGVRKALGIGTVMFFMGVLLGYFMVYPLTLRFLSTYQLSAAIENQISLNSYIDNFMMLVLCMGLAFELPLVTWLLSLLGLVHKSFLRKYRRHAVVIIVIASAIITHPEIFLPEMFPPEVLPPEVLRSEAAHSEPLLLPPFLKNSFQAKPLLLELPLLRPFLLLTVPHLLPAVSLVSHLPCP